MRNEIPASSRNFLLFTLVLLIVGIGAMVVTGNVSADSIATLVAAILGVVGTHVGHVVGHQQSTATAQRDVERLTALVVAMLDRDDPATAKDLKA